MFQFLRSDFELPFGVSMVVGFVLLLSLAWVADTILNAPPSPRLRAWSPGSHEQFAWTEDTPEWHNPLR